MSAANTSLIQVEFSLQELKVLDRILQFHDCSESDDQLKTVEAIESKLAEVLY